MMAKKHPLSTDRIVRSSQFVGRAPDQRLRINLGFVGKENRAIIGMDDQRQPRSHRFDAGSSTASREGPDVGVDLMIHFTAAAASGTKGIT